MVHELLRKPKSSQTKWETDPVKMRQYWDLRLSGHMIDDCAQIMKCKEPVVIRMEVARLERKARFDAERFKWVLDNLEAASRQLEVMASECHSCFRRSEIAKENKRKKKA